MTQSTVHDIITMTFQYPNQINMTYWWGGGYIIRRD